MAGCSDGVCQMNHYFYVLCAQSILFKLSRKQVYLLPNRLESDSLIKKIVRRIPFLNNYVPVTLKKPIADYQEGILYRIYKDTLDCNEYIVSEMRLEHSNFVKVYNKKFQTDKIEPFVLKWTIEYVYDMLVGLYKVYFDNARKKTLYLHDNELNRYIYEWWKKGNPNSITIKWLSKGRIVSAIQAAIYIQVLFISALFSHGICFHSRKRAFKVMKVAVWGLKRSVFRDDFIVDGDRFKEEDLLLYANTKVDPSQSPAFQEAVDSQYQSVNIKKLKIPLLNISHRLIPYHLLFPLIFILRNFFSERNYLNSNWLIAFHRHAIEYEVLLSHYKVGVELSIAETSIKHIPETVILNNHGAKSVIWHWSDATVDHWIPRTQYMAFDTFLVWGTIHYNYMLKHSWVNRVIETGLIFNHNLDDLAKDRKRICEAIGIGIADGTRIVTFCDESFGTDKNVATEKNAIEFWKMMADLISTRPDVVAVLKPKWAAMIDRYERMAKESDSDFHIYRDRCIQSGRVFIVKNPMEIDLMDTIAISDIVVNMGMSSPATIAILCGRIGLYLNITSNVEHPFAKDYKDIITFDNYKDLLMEIDNIFDNGHNPVSLIEPDLLKEYDRFRDSKGLDRFRMAVYNEISLSL